MFEDDGTIASGSTSVAYDSQRGRLFMHGKALYSHRTGRIPMYLLSNRIVFAPVDSVQNLNMTMS